MADAKDLKKQRDRFLAFSFASADLFMEVGLEGQVIYALGAARSLTGVDHSKLTGQQWLDVFAPGDRMVLAAMHGKARAGERCGPLAVTMDEKLGGGRKAIVTGIRMPDSDCFYLTVGFTSALMERVAETIRQQAEYELLDKDTFLYAAKEALDLARSLGQHLEMTLLDIADTRSVKKKLGDEVWAEFTAAVTTLLGSHSVDGGTAAMIGEGRYSVIHDPSVSTDKLREELAALAKKSDPEGKGFEVRGKTVSADLQSLSERETMKALIYTINEFERKGTTLSIDNLNTGFKTYVTANAQKIHQFKTMISTLSFDFNFHPIVNLENGKLSHFEMLSRFKEQGSTREWVIFGEDIGMAADFDIAVCERAINYIMYKSSGHRTKFAINLSGQSIQNEQFFKTLLAKLTMHKDLGSRMVFEITESTGITELEMVNHFIQTLQKNGFKVCLDDFGAGAASFQYLQKLDVDYVKIDGQYTQKVLESEKDAVLVRNLAKMCKDLKIDVIAERIEEEKQLQNLRAMGIPLGQGFYFAHPAAKPEYDPKNIAAE